jgi:hypothetical protein
MFGDTLVFLASSADDLFRFFLCVILGLGLTEMLLCETLLLWGSTASF